MKNYTCATTKHKAVTLLNQFRTSKDRVFSERDFAGCENEIQIENRYKDILTKLMNGEMEVA